MNGYRPAEFEEPLPEAAGAWWIDPKAEKSPTRTLMTIDGAALAGVSIPQRAWHVEGLIPAATVTLLGGDGGTGKSLIAVQLAGSTALGRLWLGRECRSGPCLFLTAEDDLDEVHRRLADIVADQGIAFEDLTDLHVASLAGEDAVLASADARAATIRPTALFHALQEKVEALKPVLVVLDTLSDLFAGDENQRAQARQFIGLLRGLALKSGAAVLLLAHPSLSGMSSGSGLSGSTAWNNSVRSRLYFERVRRDDGSEDDPDLRVLKLLKANYGQTGSETRVRWRAGVFVEEGRQGESFGAIAATARADRVFLDLLVAYEAEGRHVSHTPSISYAPTVFARDARANGLTRDKLAAAMNRLFATGAIRAETFGPPSRRYGRIVPC